MLEELIRIVYALDITPMNKSIYQAYLGSLCRKDDGSRYNLNETCDAIDVSSVKLMWLQEEFQKLFYGDYLFRKQVDAFVESLPERMRTLMRAGLKNLLDNFEG